jgi:hypothetical protein
MFHLVTKEIIAQGATIYAFLDGARPRLALLVRQSSIAPAAIASDVLSSVLLVTEYLAPAIDQSLSDGRVIGSRCAQVAIVAAVTNHLFHLSVLLSCS